MIISFNRYNGGGGSGSGVTPEQVQQQINSALTPYWESGETKDYVDEAVSGIDLSDYYTSAQTEDAITSKNYVTSAQVETQIVSKNYITSAETANFVTSAQVETQIQAKNYVNSGDVKSQVEAYNYATVSQIPTVPTSNTAFTNDAGYITDAAIENLVTSAQVETQIDTKAAAYTPTSGFSTINGSAITNGGNIVIEGGADMSAYYTSAQTEDAISAATSGKADAANVGANVGSQIFPKWNKDGIITGQVSQAYFSSNYYINGVRREPLFNRQVDVQTRINIYAPVSAGTAGDILVSKGNGAPVWSAVTMPDMSEYWTSAETKAQIDELADELSEAELVTSTSINDIKDNMVSSAYVNTIWRGTQAEYDTLVLNNQIDNNTLYVIL